MPGITISGKKPATSKLISEIASYMFEQQYDEFEKATEADKKALKKAIAVLTKINK